MHTSYFSSNFTSPLGDSVRLNVSLYRTTSLTHRCIPSNQYRSYAFVEFRSQRDAEDAYYDMHGRYFEGSRLSIQWAKNPPSSVWRYERRERGGGERGGDRAGDRASPPPRRGGGDRERSRSPRRRGGDRDDGRDGRDDRDGRGDERRRRSRTPERKSRRSPSPDRRRDDRARTPPMDDIKVKDERDDRAQTPPYDH